jgi:hypothetical protein
LKPTLSKYFSRPYLEKTHHKINGLRHSIFSECLPLLYLMAIILEKKILLISLSEKETKITSKSLHCLCSICDLLLLSEYNNTIFSPAKKAGGAGGVAQVVERLPRGPECKPHDCKKKTQTNKYFQQSVGKGYGYASTLNKILVRSNKDSLTTGVFLQQQRDESVLLE